MSLTDAEQAALLAQPVTLPCGLVLPNRLVKVRNSLAVSASLSKADGSLCSQAAMEEVLGTLEGDPSEKDSRLYAEWAKGGWGLVITGARWSLSLLVELQNAQEHN